MAVVGVAVVAVIDDVAAVDDVAACAPADAVIGGIADIVVAVVSVPVQPYVCQ